MTNRRLIPHGTAAALDAAVLLAGEVAIDDTNDELRWGDGATTGGLKAARKDLLAAADGDQLIGRKRTSTAILRTLYAEGNDTIPLTAYHLGDGTDATAAFAAAMADAVTEGKRLILPRSGHFLGTNIPVTMAGLRLEGDGDSSRFTVGANNSNVFNVSAADVRMKGLKLEGDNTTSSSINGNGIYVTGADFQLEDVYFTGHGHGAVRGYGASSLRGPKITRAKVRSQGSAGVDFLWNGAWQSALFEDLDCVNTGSASSAVSVFEDTGLYWQYVEVRGGRFQDYSKWGVSVSDELWDGSDRVYGFVVNKGFYKNCGQAAIKAKLSKGIQIDGPIVESCGATLENGPAGLYGAILLNSIGQMEVTNAILRDSDHGAIVVNGNDGPTKSYPGGYGLPSINISDNIIERVTSTTSGYGSGIVALGRCNDVAFVNNSVRQAAKHGLYANGANLNGIKSLRSIGNYVADSAATDYGTRFVNIHTVTVAGDEVFDYGGIHASFESCYSVSVDGSARYHDGRSATPLVLAVNVVKFDFNGRADCALYSAWAPTTAYVEGNRVSNGGNAYECTVAGTSAGSGGPTGTSKTTELTDGTAKWAYIHKARLNTYGIQFSGTAPEIARIGSGADFSYITTSPTTGAPSNLKREGIASGSATLASGTAAVTVFPAEQDASYKVNLSGNAAETFTWASKAAGGFTINSSNASSTATVDWSVFR